MTRSFIAVNLPVEARKSISKAATTLRDSCGSQIKWVKPYQYHLTLAFLGDVKEEQLPAIVEVTASVVADIPPFSVEIAGLGAFPSVERSRVVWLGVSKGGDSLFLLYTKLWAVLGDLGFSDDGRFHPHLTLGRVKGSHGDISIADLVTRFAEKAWTSFRVDQLSLMKSDLTPKGAVYTQLSAMPLLGRDL